MDLTAIRPALATPSADPGQPTLPGLETDVVARVPVDGSMAYPVKVVGRAPVEGFFRSFESAVEVAREILVEERRDARWGLFNRLPGRVDAFAVVQADQGIELLRTDTSIDPYKETVPGAMAPGQHWWKDRVQQAVRETPATLALVGAEHLVDLRSGRPTDRVAFPKD